MIHIDIAGMDEVVSALIAAAEGIGTGAAEGLRRAGKFIEADAKANCPVDTGNLRASITSQTEGNVCVIGTNVEYGIYQELGTYKMRAHPYLVPALVNNAERCAEVIGKALMP